MKPDLKKYLVIAAVLVFVGLPILFYILGDFPRRSVLKESISLLTLLAFSLMLGQFFLARSNMEVIKLYSLRRIRSVHTVIAYSAVSLLLLHPFLIVLPRYFEAGVDPWDAFVTVLTTFDSAGIIFGLIAWVMLFGLTMTAMFRIRLIKTLRTNYPRWRHFHGILSITLTVFAIVHAIELGRHTHTAMAVFMVVLAVAGVAMLMRMYLPSRSRAQEPAPTPKTAGEK